MTLFLLSLGGSLGAISRYVIGAFIMRKLPHPPIPVAILAVNLAGSFGLGMFLALYQQFLVSETYHNPLYLLAAVGFFGAFTTFSTFSMEALELVRTKQHRKALLYIACSIIGSMTLFICGYLLGKVI